MNKEEYFFNTYLGRELNVCGDLIYKGFEALENNQQNILNNDYWYQELGIKDSVDFLQEAPAFIFWINNSIAFERLGKIIVLFLEFSCIFPVIFKIFHSFIQIIGAKFFKKGIQ